jgi:hypothetical protein
MQEWIDRYALALGVTPPSDSEMEELLELAGLAAHASVRQAAPISCWLAARAGVSPREAVTTAASIAADASDQAQ